MSSVSGNGPQPSLLAGSRATGVKTTECGIKEVKQSHCTPGVGLEGSRRLRFPDFKTGGK